MASQHLILRTACGTARSDEPPRADATRRDHGRGHAAGPNPARRRYPGQKVGRTGRTPPTSSSAGANLLAESNGEDRNGDGGLESLPIWCDVTVLSEVVQVVNNNENFIGNDDGREMADEDDAPTTTTSNNKHDYNNASGKDNGSGNVPYVVRRQRLNPCGTDNVLVFPSSSSENSGGSGASSSYLLRLSSCRTSSSLILLGGGDAKMEAVRHVVGTSAGTSKDDNTSSDGQLILDLPVRPHPATLAFVTGKSDASNSNDSGTALLAIEFDLRPARRALQAIVTEAEEEAERVRVEDVEAKKTWSLWNPMSWRHPLGGGGNSSNGGGIPANRIELERMLEEMLAERSYNAQQQQFGLGGGTSIPPSTSVPPRHHGSSRNDLLLLQAAMDREIRELNLMLSGLGLLGLALVGSYVYTVRRILHRRPASASGRETTSKQQQQQQSYRQRTSTAGSDAPSCGRSFGDSGSVIPPPISTIKIARDTVVQGLGMANIGDALKAAVGSGVASVTASAAASCSPSKSDGGSVSTAPSTPETPSPRAKKQGQHLHPEHVQEQEERSPEVAAKPVVVEKRKQLSPERKEIINALLARVKAPTPVKPAAEDEDDDSRTTSGETRMPMAVVATPEKTKQTEKIAASKVNKAANKNTATTPVPSRKPMSGRKAVGGKVGGAFAAIPGDESSAAATPASNITPDIFAPTPSTLPNGMEGIVTAGSGAVHTPTLTPMRSKARVGDGGSFARRPKSQVGRSKSDAIPAVVDPRGSPSSFAQMLLQKQQQLTPPKQEHPRTMAQGNISLGGLQKKKKQQQPQQQQSKPRRKLTPPPKSKGGDVTASAFEGLGNDEDGETTMIQGRNLNDAIENTFFKDYWDDE